MGFVKAVDADEGINAIITYSIPADLPFTIDEESGEIFTNRALDYESQKVLELQAIWNLLYSVGVFRFLELPVCCHG